MLPIKYRTVQLCIVYAYCGLYDMIDGMIACKLHTESEMGAILDGISDLCFAASYAANVLPKLQFDNWVIWVIAAVITICACSVAAGFVALRWFIMRHTIANRITGCLLFLLPFANLLFSGKEQALTAIAVCNACACFAALTAAVWEAMMTFMEIAGNSNGNAGGG